MLVMSKINVFIWLNMMRTNIYLITCHFLKWILGVMEDFKEKMNLQGFYNVQMYHFVLDNI